MAGVGFLQSLWEKTDLGGRLALLGSDGQCVCLRTASVEWYVYVPGKYGPHGELVGDILRRLVSRTMAQQMRLRRRHSSMYALSTTVGCECVAHVVRALTNTAAEATAVSIVGIGAFDLISRNCWKRPWRLSTEIRPSLL